MPHSPEPLPEPFIERLARIVPADRLGDCLASFAQEKPTAFRVNTLKRAVEEVRDELEQAGFSLQPVDWLPGALTIDPGERRRLTETAAVAEGRIYIQGLSIMVAPLVLAPEPGERVLDLAAAPGGKTLQMAAMMQNQGEIAAVEPIRKRMYKLRANLRQHGVTIVKTFLTDGRSVGRKTPERFDRVLLDAPCSGEARFDQRDPSSWRNWGPRKIRECARKQKGLLRSALAALKPGGTLLYCTCSFAPEENEMVVDRVLAQLGEVLSVQPIELPFAGPEPGLPHWDGKDLHPALAHTVRILPDRQMGAFYLCKLAKRQTAGAHSHARRLHSY
jgi:16S rRNA (cytosine1407-C5)-methyltransferase